MAGFISIGIPIRTFRKQKLVLPTTKIVWDANAGRFLSLMFYLFLVIGRFG